MKKQALLLIVGITLLVPTLSSAAYLIQLKNGSTLLVNHYWEENGQVRFYRYGGEVGFPKSAIQEITKTSTEYVEEEGATAYIPEAIPVAKEEEPGEQKVPEQEAPPEKKKKKKKKKEKKLSFEQQRQVDLLQKQSDMAWELARQGKNKAERDEARKKALELSKKLKKLMK